MQLKNGDWKYSNVIERILKPIDTILQPGTRTTIWFKSQLYTNNEASGIEQLSPLPERAEDLFFAQHFRQPKTTCTFYKSAYSWKTHIHSTNRHMERIPRSWPLNKRNTWDMSTHSRWDTFWITITMMLFFISGAFLKRPKLSKSMKHIGSQRHKFR